jgi:hypothetical protein
MGIIMQVLAKIWSLWKRWGRWLGDAVARLVLSVLYFTIVLPFGLIVRLTSDRLDTSSLRPTWHATQTTPPTMDRAREQS